MAVQTETLVNGKETHYVRIWHRGKFYNRRVGSDKQAAERLNARLLGDKSALEGDSHSKLARVRVWLPAMLAKRTGRAATGEKQQVTDHVMCFDWFMAMRVCDVDPPAIRKVVESIRAKGRLSESSITNIHSVLSGCFQWAVFDKLIEVNPCRGLPKGVVIRGKKKRRDAYTRAEARAAMNCESIRRDMRVFLYLAFYSGMREGEICGRKFKDWQAEGQPLGALHIHDQYDGEKLKTDDAESVHPRWVPVHKELEKVLTEWWETGFEAVYCRQPTVDDFIVPTTTEGGVRPHSRSSAYKAFRTALRAAGISNRTLHSTRHTFITVARSGRYKEEEVEKLTHNAKGSTLDQYTHAEWETLCEIVANVDYSIDRSTTAGFVGGGPPKRRPLPGQAPAAHAEVRTEKVGHSTVIEHNGQSMPVSAWEKAVGIPRKTIADRLNFGWSTERALTTPIDCRRKPISYQLQSNLQSLQEIRTK